MTHLTTAAVTLAAAGVARAQFTPDSTVSYTLAWQESDANGLPAGNGNGILEPGEHALLRLTVSFTNQNTVATFAPPIGTFTSGTIRAFGAGIIDLIGANGAQGSWNTDMSAGLGVDPNWGQSPGSGGTPAAGGSLLQNIFMYQGGGSPSGILTANPVIDIWRGVWTPASFSARTVTFASTVGSAAGGQASAVVLVFLNTQLGFAFCPSIFGSVQIPIVPAPASALLLAAALAFPRRSRGPHT